MDFLNSLPFAQSLDAQDDLRHLRDSFIIPQKEGKEQIYFLGNSLGLQPKSTNSYLQQVLEQWSTYGVEGFFEGAHPWLHYHDSLTAPLGKIVGALPHEVVVMNQLTVNLHLMMISFYNPHARRNKIICEAKAFPSDQYMLETHVQQRGLRPEEVIIEVAPREGSFTIHHDDIIAAIEKHKDELALVLWGGVNFYTGQLFDIKGITEAAHKAGAKAGFDLAHAAGNVALQLHEWNVDFACWCSYKYLNAGPGAVGAAFVHERYHHDKSLKRFAGWWGYNKEKRFFMEPHFDAIPSAEGWQLSTPSPLLYAAHKASLHVFEQTDMEKLTAKSKQLSSYLLFLLQDINQLFQTPMFQVITPVAAAERGSQVSILVKEKGRKIFEYLSVNGVFADWREPNVMRVAPVPLYNTFEEVYTFAHILKEAVKENA